MTEFEYTHRTRSGDKARIIGEIKDDVYPIVVAILSTAENKEYLENFTKNLKCIDGDDSEYDLIEYNPWNDVAVDTPVMVCNDPENNLWIKRHFAKFDDGLVSVWADGRTSWTTNEMFPYQYAKLAME